MVDEATIAALRTALDERNFERAAEIVSDGTPLDSLIEDDGSSPLHDAAQIGDVETVRFYLALPCARTLQSFDYVQATPLVRAAGSGQLDVVRLLLAAGVDVDAHDENLIGDTAIVAASWAGHVDVVRALLKAGADPMIRCWMGLNACDRAFTGQNVGAEDGDDLRDLFRDYPSDLREPFLKQQARRAQARR